MFFLGLSFLPLWWTPEHDVKLLKLLVLGGWIAGKKILDLSATTPSLDVTKVPRDFVLPAPLPPLLDPSTGSLTTIPPPCIHLTANGAAARLQFLGTHVSDFIKDPRAPPPPVPAPKHPPTPSQPMSSLNQQILLLPSQSTSSSSRPSHSQGLSNLPNPSATMKSQSNGPPGLTGQMSSTSLMSSTNKASSKPSSSSPAQHGQQQSTQSSIPLTPCVPSSASSANRPSQSLPAALARHSINQQLLKKYCSAPPPSSPSISQPIEQPNTASPINTTSRPATVALNTPQRDYQPSITLPPLPLPVPLPISSPSPPVSALGKRSSDLDVICIDDNDNEEDGTSAQHPTDPSTRGLVSHVSNSPSSIPHPPPSLSILSRSASTSSSSLSLSHSVIPTSTSTSGPTSTLVQPEQQQASKRPKTSILNFFSKGPVFAAAATPTQHPNGQPE
jgi:hypothetical protein